MAAAATVFTGVALFLAAAAAPPSVRADVVGTDDGYAEAAAGVGTGATGTPLPTPSPTATSTMLAALPPMGWSNWYGINSAGTQAYTEIQADALYTSGLSALGYRVVTADDDWADRRDEDGNIVPSSAWPDMKGFGDYLHARDLLFSIYTDRGIYTCAGRPGSQGYEGQDAATYASWGVDVVREDNCNATRDMREDYALMRQSLEATGRPMIFWLIAWTFRTWMPAVGNLWRTTPDAGNDWQHELEVFDLNQQSAAYAGPGHWNDPDILLTSNYDEFDFLSLEELKSQFSLWCIAAAPLMLTGDITHLSQPKMDIVANAEVIAIDQDPLGIQGTLIQGAGSNLTIYGKKLANGGYAVALHNRDNVPRDITLDFSNLPSLQGVVAVRDLWAHQDMGSYTMGYTASDVPAHGTVMLVLMETALPTSTTTPTPTPTAAVATSTSTPIPCMGDCNHDRTVSVAEVVDGVNIALGVRLPESCSAFDCDGNQRLTVDCLVKAVNNALTGCPTR